MGTRGLTKVILDGEVKVLQYGQWDHYPKGQGVDGLRIVSRIVEEGRLEEFKSKVRKTRGGEVIDFPEVREWAEERGLDPSATMTNTQWDEFTKRFPQFTRNTGAQILKVIDEFEGESLPLDLDIQFESDHIFCEGIVILDLDNEEFGFQNWQDTPIMWPLRDLPSEGEFVFAFYPDA